MNQQTVAGKYSITGLVKGAHPLFKNGTRCWIISEDAKKGFEWLGTGKSGRLSVKFMLVKKFHNFQASEIPAHIRRKA